MGDKCSMMLIIFSWGFLGISEVKGGGNIGDQPPCMKQLLPCSMYLHRQSPPSSCCDPLKDLISTDVKCLCDVFTNPAIMISLNVTQADAMNLANRCGANVDENMCKDAVSSPTVSPSPSNSSASSNTNSTDAGSSKSAATRVSRLEGSYILLILYCIISISISIF